MGKFKNNQSGFGGLETLLIFVVVVAVAALGWYVYNAKQTTDKTLKANTSVMPKFKKYTKPVVDPTADWITYKGADSKITLKYPKTWVMAAHPELCSPGILLLGADSASVGACGSENFGQVSVTWLTSQPACGDLNADSYTVNSKTTVTVSGVSGLEQLATSKVPAEGPSTLPAGTKVVNYCFTSGGYTYVANYAKLAAYPDALADFNLMVTKTLKFN